MASIAATGERNPRSGALAEIGYASILDSDTATPSEDETSDQQPFPLEDAHSVIGVSISHAQTRLTNPKTPAHEKARLIENEGGFFTNILPDIEDGVQDESQEEGESPQSRTKTTHRLEQPPEDDAMARAPSPIKPSNSPPERLPSPWKAGPKTDWKKVPRAEETRSSLRESFNNYRRRLSAGQEGTPDGQKRAHSFGLPKSPSLFTFSLSNLSYLPSNDQPLGFEDNQKRKRSSTFFGYSSPKRDTFLNTDSQSNSSQQSQLESTPHDTSAKVSTAHPTPSYNLVRTKSPISMNHSGTGAYPLLRRSTSDDSSLLHRNLSRASSLGDDTRFENVSGQVNARFKAIKDSFQDANFRLPALPARTSFHFGLSRPDLLTDKLSYNGTRISSYGTVDSRGSLPSPRLLNIPTRSRGGSTSESSSLKDTGTSSAFALSHPYFVSALEQLEGDIVVLGGYRGSILRSAEPPHQQLWAPIKIGLNLRKVDLEVGLNPEDEERMRKKIIPGGMLTHIGPVDISKRLLKRLKACENAKNGKLRVHNYGYDWRLSPHLLSRQLLQFLQGLPCNASTKDGKPAGAIVIAHSLGGLITRHAINQQPELVSGVVYAGVPQGCVNILGPLRNGDDVLMSSRVLTAQVNFTIRTSFALLPLDGRCFIDKNTKEEYPVDFFNPDDWVENRWSPCISPPLPSLTPTPVTGLSGIIGSMANALPNISLLGRGGSFSKPKSPVGEIESKVSNITTRLGENSSIAPQMDQNQPSNPEQTLPANASVSTTVTLPREACLDYLRRTLAEVKQFKEELVCNPCHSTNNRYPPTAIIYGKSIPTVFGAKVDGRDGIKRADAYDELAFASGDGVVLARAAMVPEGYSVVRGGVVASERGHVTLLGDLEAVGRCLNAIIGARKKGVGVRKPECNV